MVTQDFHASCFVTAFGMLEYSSVLRGKDEANRSRENEFHAVTFAGVRLCAHCGKAITGAAISNQTQTQVDAAGAASVLLNIRVQEAG